MDERNPDSNRELFNSGAAPRVNNSGPVTAAERWLFRRFLGAAGHPAVTVQFWDGSTASEAPADNGCITVADRASLWRLMTNPGLNFGEEYANGRLRIDGDIVRVLEQIYRTRPASADKGLFTQSTRLATTNTLSGSRSNIRHHYDIGNAFYRLWLDPEMVYTCAYFPEPEMELADAQVAKMDHVCRKLRLKPGETVVEAGCGWGSLARHMARHYGVKVKAFNISGEQIKYARDMARAQKLDDRIEYIEDDYRNIRGNFDAFVSVGMLEHVGPENYHQLGKVIDGCLSANGRGLIHTIGKNRSEPLGAWLNKYIFPGAHAPSLTEMMDIFEPRNFSVLDVENLRLHYAKTLQHWLDRFENQTDAVEAMFDERFIRIWRLYLAGSIACFTTGKLQLFQVLFARPTLNDLPWSRQHLHQNGKRN